MLSIFLGMGKNFYFKGQENFHFLPNFFFIERLSLPSTRHPGPAGMYGAPFTFQQVDVSLIEFQALPGPKARALRAKIMRQHSVSGLGGQAVLSPGTGLFRCRGGRAPGGPASICGNPIGSPDGFLFPPMLFPRNALAPGPQVCFFAKRKEQK